MKKRFIILCLLCPAVMATFAQGQTKELYLPDSVWKVPPHNDYSDSTSEYSFIRMIETENLAVFWAKRLGQDPSLAADSTERIDLEFAMQELERFYDYYVNKLQFVVKGQSVTDSFKTILYIFGEEDGTAYGGGEEEKIGILWTPPVRMNKTPYGALAHELGHSFQYLLNADRLIMDSSVHDRAFGRSIYEMTSQYMLWHVYPDWMTFENYHLVSFMKKTHYAFLHETNMYHSPYVLEYWSNKHGKKFIGKLWREAKDGEDPVMTYKRLTHTNQSSFNDEMFDAARRFVTWDMDRIREVAKPYANQHFTTLDTLENGWYRITPEKCPQNYGYNAIKLEVPQPGTKIKLEFQGIAGTEGFRSIELDKAGWRYGFLAMTKDGKRIYGDTYSATRGKGKFTIPDETQHLWLVVTGAPTEHWEHIVDGKDENDEQWPYQFKINGTAATPEMLRENQTLETTSK